MDHHFMAAAVALSRRARGSTWPNPAVGCLLVQAGRIVGQGITAPGGRPHAETQALAMAGPAASGATAYVTLEPCAHHGQTPPCATALIHAGIARVVVAATDPDPRVNGGGIAALRAAGIEVTEGIGAAAAHDILAGFFTRIRHGRPLVTLKLATTLDGRIATASGDSQWITGIAARRAGHALRGQHDAVLVGVGTVLADNPDLTCRIPGYTARPMVRVVADSHLRTPLTARIVATAREHPTWLVHRDGADPARRQALTQAGVLCLEVPAAPSGVDIAALLTALGTQGLTSIFAEGGAQLAAALVRAGTVDRLAWFHAPSLLGGDALAALRPLGIGSIAAMPRFRRVAQRDLGPDLLSEFIKAD